MRTAILIGLYYIGDAVYRLSGVTDGHDMPGMALYAIMIVIVMIADIADFARILLKDFYIDYK